MLGEMKHYYCKGNYIWLDENGDITSHCREEYKKDRKSEKPKEQ